MPALAERAAARRRFTVFTPLREATLDPASRVARVIIMTEGLGNLRDLNFYSAEAVKSAARVFDGKPFFVDHPSAREEEDRPERSVRDLAGYFYDTEIGTARDPASGESLQACFAKLKFADSEPGRLAFEQMKEALEYDRRFPESKETYAGLSINGGGVSHPATIRGMEVNMVTEIQEAFSADIVTKPARGGRFVALMREARRAAAWNRGRAREDRAGRRTRMATAAGIDPKVKKHVLEARQAFKALGTAVEAKQAAEIPGALKTLTEAFGKCAPDAALKKLAESAVGKIAAFTKLLEQGDENLDPGTLVADIKDDVDRLDDLIGGGGAAADQGGGGEAEMEDAAAEGEEEGAEGEGAEGEGEHEDEQDYGMGEHDDAGNGGGPGAMRYSCASCGETNRVLPPKGFQLARMGESAKGPKGHEALVGRLRRALEQKEQRFVHHNRETRQLLKENTELRARLLAGQRLQEASKMLREAGVPPDIMRAKALLPFEPEQWPTMISVAKNALAKESAPLQRGGAGPRASGSGGAAGSGGEKETGTIFKEAYKRPHDIVG